MNKIFKVVWSRVKECYVVVPERAKNVTKSISTVGFAAIAAGCISAGIATVEAQTPLGTKAEGVNTYTAISNVMLTMDKSKNSNGLTLEVSKGYTVNQSIGDDSQGKRENRAVPGSEIDKSEGTNLSQYMYLGNAMNPYNAFYAGIQHGLNTKAAYSNYKNQEVQAFFRKYNEDDEEVLAGAASVGVGNAVTARNGSVAVGDYAYANASDEHSFSDKKYKDNRIGFATALGSYAVARGSSANAIGAGSYAWGHWATAIGRQSAALGGGSVAIAPLANSVGYGSVAIGQSATAVGEQSVALGGANGELHNPINGKRYNPSNAAVALGKKSVAIGPGAMTGKGAQDDDTGKFTVSQEHAEGAIAIGAGAKAELENSLALGVSSVAKGKHASAIGEGAQALKWQDYAFGFKAVADGEESDDKAIIGQNKQKVIGNALALGSETKASKAFAVAFGYKAQANGAAALAIGLNANAFGTSDVVIGHGARTADKARSALVLGTSAYASNVNTVAIGNAARATNVSAIAVGGEAAGNGSLAFGYTANAEGDSSGAFGYGANAKAHSAFALGIEAIAAAQSSLALGAHTNVTTVGGVALGEYSVADRAANDITPLYMPESADENDKKSINATKGNRGAVSVGGRIKVSNSGTPGVEKNYYRQITNVGAGAADSDAVNVAQLKSLATLVKRNSEGFTVSGADSTKQTIKIGDKEKHNIQFLGEKNKIDVTVTKDDKQGAIVTVKANENLGKNLNITENKSITDLKAGFKLKAGANIETVPLGETPVPEIIFEGDADNGLEVNLTGKKIQYTLKPNKLAPKIVTEINKGGDNTVVKNIEAKFKISADEGNVNTVTLNKTSEPIIKFTGEGSKLIKTSVDSNTVKFTVDENELNNVISNNKTVVNNAQGLQFAGDDGAAADKVITKKPGEKLDIIGGAEYEASKLTDKNIAVVNDGGKLHVKLAKELTDLTKVTVGSGDKTTTITGELLTVNGDAGVRIGRQAGGGANTAEGNYVTGLANTAWETGKIVDNRAATEAQLKAVETKLTNATTQASQGWTATINEKDDTQVTPGSKFNFKAGTNVVLKKEGSGVEIGLSDNVVTTDKDKYVNGGSVTYDVNANTASNPSDKGTLKLTVNGETNPITVSGLKNTYIIAADTAPDGKNIALKRNDGESINVELKPVVDNIEKTLTEKGLNFAGDDFDKSKDKSKLLKKKLGEEVVITGGEEDVKKLAEGNNIGVFNEKDKLNIRLAKALTGLTSITVGDTGNQTVINGGTTTFTKNGGTTTIEGDTITVGKDGDQTTINKGTITAKKITVTEAPTANTDVTNKEYVDKGRTKVDKEDNSPITVRSINNGANGVTYKVGINATELAGLTNLTYADDSGKSFAVALNKGLKFKNSKNIVTSVAENGEVTHNLANDITVGGAGANGTPGTNGKIGVDGSNGKNGVTITAEAINGVDGAEGRIGLTGKDGVNGTTTVTIRTEKGQLGEKGAVGKPGIDGKDFSRIVYNDGKDGKNGTDHTVATLDDGMGYKGDVGAAVTKKLNETLNVTGGQTDENKLTNNNIGVVNDGNGGLSIKLSNELKGLKTVESESFSSTDTAGNKNVMNSTSTTVTNKAGDKAEVTANGVTISNKAGDKVVSLTKEGLNNGGNRITKVAAGTEKDDAVNVGQLENYVKTNSMQSFTVSNNGTETATIGNGNTVDFIKGDNTIVTVEKTANGATVKVDLDDELTIGKGDNKVEISGKTGVISTGGVTVDGAKNTVKAGDVTVDGLKSELRGLSNVTTKVDGFAKSNRAATEEQLKELDDFNVKYDTNKDGTVNKDKISLAGNKDKGTVIDNVGDGKIEEGSKEAVNGGQLAKMKNEGLKFEGKDGKSYTAPLGSTLKVLGDANITTTVDAEKGSLTVGLANQITVADGVIAGNGKTAVRVNTDGKGTITGLTNRSVDVPGFGTEGRAATEEQVVQVRNSLKGDIIDVAASGAALAGLKPIQYDPLEPTQIMAAIGGYEGSHALALGLSHYKNESTLLHAGVSVGTSNPIYNVGITWKFGSRSHEAAVADRYRRGPISSVYALQDEVSALRAELQALRQEIAEAKKEKENK